LNGWSGNKKTADVVNVSRFFIAHASRCLLIRWVPYKRKAYQTWVPAFAGTTEHMNTLLEHCLPFLSCEGPQDTSHVIPAQAGIQ